MTTKTKKSSIFIVLTERKNDDSADKKNASSRRYGAALESGQRGEKESEESHGCKKQSERNLKE